MAAAAAVVVVETIHSPPESNDFTLDTQLQLLAALCTLPSLSLQPRSSQKHHCVQGMKGFLGSTAVREGVMGWG